MPSIYYSVLSKSLLSTSFGLKEGPFGLPRCPSLGGVADLGSLPGLHVLPDLPVLPILPKPPKLPILAIIPGLPRLKLSQST